MRQLQYMDWQQLIGFYNVVRLNSYTKAAEEVFRTQSCLSQQIKKLEENLECQLLDRNGRNNIQLTAQGQVLFNYIEELIQHQNGFFQQLLEIQGESKGRVRLTAPNGTLLFQLAAPLREFRKRYPDVSLHISEAAPQTSVDMVMDGSMDFCITHESVIPKSFSVYPWKTGEYAFLTPHDHPLTRFEKLRMDDVVKYPLILPHRYARRTARRNFDYVVSRLGLPYHVVFESSNTSINAEYVKLGMGVAFNLTFEKYRDYYQKDVAFLFMEDLFPPENISIGVRQGHALSRAKQNFLEFLLAWDE